MGRGAGVGSRLTVSSGPDAAESLWGGGRLSGEEPGRRKGRPLSAVLTEPAPARRAPCLCAHTRDW